VSWAIARAVSLTRLMAHARGGAVLAGAREHCRNDDGGVDVLASGRRDGLDDEAETREKASRGRRGEPRGRAPVRAPRETPPRRHRSGPAQVQRAARVPGVAPHSRAST